MTGQTTSAHIVKSQRGDTAAFARLMRDHYSYAYALAMRLVCNETDAEDVVQEAFVRAWKNLSQFDPNTRFTTWLYKIVTNLSIDSLRSRKHRPSPAGFLPGDALTGDLADNETPESLTSSRDLAKIIEDLAGVLPETQRVVFTLRDIQDLSIEEVCDCTGLSSESVRSNLHYARKRLRERLGKQYDVKGSGL